MIDLIAAAGIGGIIGFGTCALLTASKLDRRSLFDETLINDLGEEIEIVSSAAEAWAKRAGEEKSAHTRCADALTTTQRKLSAIRDIVGPTEGLRRGRMGQIIAVLDGERV